MTRSLALIALALLLTGCTRYGTRANGPFARKSKPAPPAVPPGPAPNSSPLALATDTRPGPTGSPDDNRVVPDRPPEPVALAKGYDPVGDVTPAGGVPADGSIPPFTKRKPEPQPKELPSPFAPKSPADPPTTPVPPGTPAPVAPAANPAAKNLEELKKLGRIATERWAKITDYEATVTRRELTPKGTMNDEVILYQFRKEPLGLFTRTLSESGKGREIVYSPAKYGDKIHLIIGEGDSPVPFVKAGYNPGPFSLDDKKVKEKSRYSVRDAGFGTPIGKFGEFVGLMESGKLPANALTYQGPTNRPEFSAPHIGVQLALRPGDDAMMPTGGVRQWFFDPRPDSPAYGMPVLMIARDPKGKEVEYYLFDKLKCPAGLTDAHFTPDRLGKK